MTDLTDHDHTMIHHARNRGQVIVTTANGPTTATLLAWRPREGRNDRDYRTRYARVEFASKLRANVKCDAVSLREVTA